MTTPLLQALGAISAATKLPMSFVMTEPCKQHQTIVGDSSPLIALAIIGQLELLRQMYKRVIVPHSVWEEITVQGRWKSARYNGSKFNMLNWSNW